MKLPETYIDEYFVRHFVEDNWGYILEMIEDSIEDWGEFGEQIIDELRKYDLNYISLVEKKEKKTEEK